MASGPPVARWARLLVRVPVHSSTRRASKTRIGPMSVTLSDTILEFRDNAALDLGLHLAVEAGVAAFQLLPHFLDLLGGGQGGDALDVGVGEWGDNRRRRPSPLSEHSGRGDEQHTKAALWAAASQDRRAGEKQSGSTQVRSPTSRHEPRGSPPAPGPGGSFTGLVL